MGALAVATLLNEDRNVADKDDGRDIWDRILLPALGAGVGGLAGRRFGRKYPHNPKKGTFPYRKKGELVNDDAGKRRLGATETAVENVIIGAMRRPRLAGAAAGGAVGYGVDQLVRKRKKK